MKEHTSKYRLTSDQLYHACDRTQFAFETTSDLETLSTAVGQERALDAIAFGIDMPHDGFNLYVMGSPGLGRHTFVREALEERAGLAPPPFDWCYVANYQQPHTPVVIRLPAGMGRQLRQDMKQLIEDLLSAIPAAFQGDEYRRRANEITEEFKKREDDAARELGEMASSRDIVLMRGATGFTLSPQKDGETLSHEEFKKLRTQIREVIQEVGKKEGIDLIVLGTHGQRGVQLLLGATANSVLHGSACDVLAVRVQETD